MRIFHVSAYEGIVSTGQSVLTSPSLSELFGSVDRLYVGGYANQIVASPTLMIQEQLSLDGENWTAGFQQTGVVPLPLNILPETLFQGSDDDPEDWIFGIKPPFRRLSMIVAGTGSAMLHIWATGRDRARGARSMASGG
ncbi:MAG TPA: hypothetical protein VHC69_09315 [Polyangiaceae bacterium]|nr:hypothetical protein [Polyangiaceae bacterium]